VKNSGRGSLAKLGLLPYSAFANTKESYSGWCINFIDSMLNRDGCLKIQHPMGESIALVGIISWFEAVFIRSPDGDTNWAAQVFEEFVIPWLRNLQIEPVHKDPEELYDFMIKVSNMTGSSTDVRALEPFTPTKTSDQELIQNCINLVDTVSGNCIEKSAYNKLTCRYNKDAPGYEDSPINRIRLNGAYSKAEILITAMRSNGSRPAIIDFENCTDLDEKCLKLVFKWLYRPKVLNLAGTSIKESSKFIKGLNKNKKWEDRIHFVFTPKVLSREAKLERENKTLLEENVSLKKQINEMKTNMCYVCELKNNV